VSNGIIKRMSFRPKNEAHSIAESVFSLTWKVGEGVEAFNPDVLKKIQSSKLLIEKFPKINSLTEFQFKFQLEAEPTIGNMPNVGLEMQSLRKDGTFAWMLRVLNGGIYIHCMDYSTWKEIWHTIDEVFKEVFSHLTIDKFSSVALRYIDVFYYDGELAEYSLEELFKQSTEYLTSKNFGKDHRWHCNSGWFQPIPEASKECLNQLNILAGEVNENNQIFVQIDHNLVLNSDSDINYDSLDQLFSLLHKANKNVLMSLLTEKMCKRLKLSCTNVN
jgi:uncharacterized protein (TIGR04255 family)